MTAPPPWPPARIAGLAVVVGVAILCSFWGITVRDLADTELDEFAGSGPLGILRRSISPTDGDWGAHMPLSHLIRWHVVRALGEQSPFAWRLHSASAAVLASLLAWWAVARERRYVLAAACGLLVAAHPVVSFHAHESTNYALGPLLGGLLVLALLDWERDRPRAGPMLAGAVLLGLFNDLFFVFPAGFAFLWTAGRALGLGPAPVGALTRRFLVAWGLVAAALLGPVLWFLSHLARLQSDQIIGPHADPIPSEHAGLASAAWDLSLRFAGGYLGGYLDAGERDLWVTHAPLLILVTLGAWAAIDRTDRGALHRMGVWTALGSFGLVLVARLGFGLAFGREFTTEPRIYSALVIPIALGWAGACTSLGRRGGVIALGALILAIGVPTARQLGNLSHRDSLAVATILAHHRPGDLVIANRQVRWRLPPGIVHEAQPECAEGSPADLPDRVWIARPDDGQELPSIPSCDGEGPDLLATGAWRLRYHARLFPPAYDRRSASFLPELGVYLLERGAGPSRPDGVPLIVRFEPGPLSAGSSSARARLLVQPDRGGRPDLGPEPRTIEEPWADVVRFPAVPVGHWVRLEGRPAEPPRSSIQGLLAPLDRPFLDLDPVPALSDPIEPERRVALPAFSAPGLLVMERVLRAMLALVLLGGVVRLGIQRRKLVASARPRAPARRDAEPETT